MGGGAYLWVVSELFHFMLTMLPGLTARPASTWEIVKKRTVWFPKPFFASSFAIDIYLSWYLVGLIWVGERMPCARCGNWVAKPTWRISPGGWVCAKAWIDLSFYKYFLSWVRQIHVEPKGGRQRCRHPRELYRFGGRWLLHVHWLPLATFPLAAEAGRAWPGIHIRIHYMSRWRIIIAKYAKEQWWDEKELDQGYWDEAMPNDKYSRRIPKRRISKPMKNNNHMENNQMKNTQMNNEE